MSVLRKYLKGIFVFHTGYVWKWLKDEDVKGRRKPDVNFTLGHQYFHIPCFRVFVSKLT